MKQRIVPLVRAWTCMRHVSYSTCLYEDKKAVTSSSSSSSNKSEKTKMKTNGADLRKVAVPDEATVAAAAAAATPSPEAYRALLHDLLLYRRETLAPVVAALQKERKLLDKRLEELDEKVEQLSQIREEIRLLVAQHKLEEQIELQKVLNKISSMEEKKQDVPAPKSRLRSTDLKF